jgi:hypothetical protein
MLELEELRVHESFNLTSQDITENPELYERFKNIIPVIAVDGSVKLAGSVLSNPKTLKETLEKAIFSKS